mgnify:CR=1 FL=1
MYPQLAYYYKHRAYKLEYQKEYYRQNKPYITQYYKKYYNNKKDKKDNKKSCKKYSIRNTYLKNKEPPKPKTKKEIEEALIVRFD